MSEHEARRPHVAYVMSRFPRLSETFVLYELLTVAESGFDVSLYPLMRQRESVSQPEAESLVERAVYLPFVSPAIVASNLRWFVRDPRRYLTTIGTVLWETRRSANFFVGAVGIAPKAVHMATLMERDGVDHVHCHFANHPAVAGYLISKLTGIGFSFTAHGHDLHVDRRMLAEKVGAARFVATVSSYNAELIAEEVGSGAEVHVVHCGVDPSVFAPHERSRCPDDPFRIVSIGKLYELKGQKELIAAVDELRRRGVDASAVLVGEGPDEASLRVDVEARGLAGHVRLAGAVARPEVARLLEEADAYAQPSKPIANGKREGIPVALMEAMSAGLPVVASAISGIPELVVHDETGLLVPPRDAGALADALERLARQPDLAARLAAAGVVKVRDEFDLATNARRLGDLFTAAIEAT